jgi:flagellar hook assembly protein FlgD
LPRPAHARLGVYDTSGRLVRRLVDEMLAAGSHGVPWDGTDQSGRHVASGVYYYRLEAQGSTAMRKVSVVR